MNKYTIKNFKSCAGEDGEAYSLTLYRDGKKVAAVINAGNGGETSFQWFDWKSERVNIEVINFDGYRHRINCTPEEALMYAEFTGKPWHLPPEYGDVERFMTPESFIVDLINRDEEMKALRRCCKKATVFTLKSVADSDQPWITLNQKFSPRVKAILKLRYGDDLGEIVNERW
jgi:hypothetical protein